MSRCGFKFKTTTQNPILCWHPTLILCFSQDRKTHTQTVLTSCIILQPSDDNNKNHCTDVLLYTSAERGQKEKKQHCADTLCYASAKWWQKERKNNNIVLMSFPMFQPRTKSHSTDVLPYVSAKDKTPYILPCFSQGQKPTVLMSYLMFQSRTKSHSTDVLPYVSAKDKNPQFWCPALCFSQGQNPTALMSYFMLQPRTKSYSTDVLPYASAKDKKPQYWCPSLCFSQGQNPTVLMSYFMSQPRTKPTVLMSYLMLQLRTKSHSTDVLPYASAKGRKREKKKKKRAREKERENNNTELTYPTLYFSQATKEKYNPLYWRLTIPLQPSDDRKKFIIIIGNLQNTFRNSKHFTGCFKPKALYNLKKNIKCANTHNDANQWYTSMQNKN